MDTLAQAGAELLGGDAALVGGQVRSGLAVRQVGTKGRHKEELAHDKDQRNGTHADEVVQSRFVADHHVAGNGVEQHFQAAAGAVLGQHLDELHADDNVQRPLKETADLYIVAIKQQARHPFEQGNEAEQQADEHQPGQHDLQQGGGLNDVAAQCLAAAALNMGGVRGVGRMGHDAASPLLKIVKRKKLTNFS